MHSTCIGPPDVAADDDLVDALRLDIVEHGLQRRRLPWTSKRAATRMSRTLDDWFRTGVCVMDLTEHGARSGHGAYPAICVAADRRAMWLECHGRQLRARLFGIDHPLTSARERQLVGVGAEVGPAHTRLSAGHPEQANGSASGGSRRPGSGRSSP